MKKLTTLLFLTFLTGAIFAQISNVQPIPPTKDGLRENYSQNDFENFLLREKLGEIPFQGSIIDNTAAVDALVNNNAGATGKGYFSQSEMSILAFGNSVIIGFNDSGSNSGGSNKFTGWSYSIDGGATFTDGGTLPTNGGGDAGDPVLARNETTGRIYYSTLGWNVSTIQMFRSDWEHDLSSYLLKSPDAPPRKILSDATHQIENHPGISRQDRSYSDRCGSGQDKFNDIPPGHNAAHPNNRNPHGLVHIPNHLDRDRLDGWPG